MDRTFFGILAALATWTAVPALASIHDGSVKPLSVADSLEPNAGSGAFATLASGRQLEAVEIDDSPRANHRPHDH